MPEYYCYGCNNCCYISEADMRENGLMNEWDEDDDFIINTWCPCGAVNT